MFANKLTKQPNSVIKPDSEECIIN